MLTDDTHQDGDATPTPQPDSFLSFAKKLEDRSDKFQQFLDETDDDMKNLSFDKANMAETSATAVDRILMETSKSMEGWQLKKSEFLQEIEDEEMSDFKILEQLAAENNIQLHSVRSGSATADRASVLSYLTLPADDEDPLQWNLDDFGTFTAKAEQMAYQDLADLIEDQKQQDGRWTARLLEDSNSSYRPLSARLENVAAENRLFYESHSKPAFSQNHSVVLDDSNDPDTDVNELDEETARLKSELAKQVKEMAEAEKQRKNKAATTIQATFRGYRIRRRHGLKLKKLIADAKKRIFEERVRKIEAESKKLMKNIRDRGCFWRRRLLELKQAEEDQRKAQIEEERKAADAERRRKEEEERRKGEEEQAERERVRLAKETEEKRQIAERLAAEKAEKERQERSIAEAEERRKAEEAGKAEEQRKMAAEIAEKERQERLLIEAKENQRQEEAEQRRIAEEAQKKNEEKSNSREKNNKKVGSNQTGLRHFPEVSPSSNLPQDAVTSAEKTVRSSTERSHSRMKEVQRKESDDAYRMAKASFEEYQVEDFVAKTDSSKKSPVKKSVEVQQESVELPKKAPETRKPRVEVDTQKLQSVQMTWVKECRPWSETVAQLKVTSTVKIAAGQNSSASSRNAVRPPPECKAVPTSDLLLRAMGRSHPSPASITCLVLSNLQAQFDLSSLSALTSLICLDISSSNFTYLCNLDGCIRLAYLNASHNKIKDVDVNKLEVLAFLDLSYNELTSLSGLSYRASLVSLNVAYNRIVRLNLATNIFFSRLNSLDVSHNQLLSTRDWLSSMPSLVSLDLSSNNLRAVDCLSSLGLLQFLNASYNSLSDIPDLANCPLLTDVDLSGNNLHAVDSISKYFLPHLLRLNLARNMLTSLPDMSSFFNLIEIRVEHNQIITYDALMKKSGLLQMARLKFVRGDFLCFSSDDATRLNDELRTRRGVEMISADYDDAIALCATLKLLISGGLLDGGEEDDDFLEFGRFVVLLQDNLSKQLGKLAEDNKQALLDSKRKATASSQLPEQKWAILNKYFDDSSKAALERRYAVEFCGIQSAPATQQQQVEVPKVVSKKDEIALSTPAVVLQPNQSSKTSKIEVKKEKRPSSRQKDAELVLRKKRETAAIVIQSGWRGFLARFEVARWHVAATYIQKTWRGYWVRKQIRAVLEQFANEPESNQGEAIVEGEDAGNDFNDKSVDELLSFLSSIQASDSVNLSARPGSRGFDKDAAHKVAWTTPVPGTIRTSRNNPAISDVFDDGATNADSPLPGSLAGGESLVPPVNLAGAGIQAASSASNRAPSKKVQHLQEEWGFADPTTVELMMKRASRMNQADKRNKMAKLDANQRLALARKQAALESYRSPVAGGKHSAADPSREQYQTHEVRMGAPVAVPLSPSESSSALASTRQNQTFAWVHSVVREPSPLPLNIGITGAFPPITTGGFMTNYTGTGIVTNRSSASNEHRRRSDDLPTTFPPIALSPSKSNSALSNNTQPAVPIRRPRPPSATTVANIPAPFVVEEKPKKRDLIRAWREPAVRLSGGWGGGRKKK